MYTRICIHAYVYTHTYTNSGKVPPRLADAGVRDQKTADGEGADAAWEREGWGLIDLPVGKGISSSSSEIFFVLKAQLRRAQPETLIWH
jgi:hypothetical protein